MRHGRSGSFAIRSIAWTRQKYLISIGRSGSSSRSDLHRTAVKTGGRTVRSWPDRTAIAARSNRDRAPSAAESPPDDRTTTDNRPRRRLGPDRGAPIAPKFMPLFEAKLKPIRRGSEATTHAQGIASMTLENRSHERFNWPRSSGQFLL